MSKLLLTTLICLLLASAARAQNAGQREMVVPLDAGFVSFKLEAVRAGAHGVYAPLPASELESTVNPQVLVDDEHVIHRALVDRDGNFIFGYDLLVQAVATTRQFKVTVRPLNPAFEQQLRARNSYVNARAQSSGQKISTFPRAADVQLINDGDAFSLDLLVNSTTGVKIIDVVKLSFDRSGFWGAQPDLEAQDFTLDNVEMSMTDYKIVINNRQVGGGRATRGVAGSLLWFYVQNKGRFIFSLAPHDGYDFKKIGIIKGDRISFDMEGDYYEWISSGPILGSNGGTWNVWVLYDPDYIPDFSVTSDTPLKPVAGERSATHSSLITNQGNDARTRNGLLQRSADFIGGSLPVLKNVVRVLVGAGDRVENLLPKRFR